MPNIHVLRSFVEAVEEQAKQASYGQTMLAGAGMGALTGLGGIASARREGEGWGESLKRGLTQGAVGAGVGAAAGAGQRAISPDKAKTFTDYGKKTLYAMTGVQPKGGIDSVGRGSTGTKRLLEEAKATHNAAPTRDTLLAVQRAKASHTAVQKAEEAGLDNLPGLAKGMVTHPIDTLQKGFNATWHGTDKLQKGMMGVGLGLSAQAALSDRGEDDTRTPLQRGAELVGNVGLQAATTPLQLATNATSLGGNLLSAFTVGQGMNSLVSLPTDEAVRALGPGTKIRTSPRALGPRLAEDLPPTPQQG